MKHNDKGSIREICYTQFERGFSDEEIIEKFGFHKRTVDGYRNKKRFWVEQLDQSELFKQRTYRRDAIPSPMFSADEMDYGTDYPVYKWSDLTSAEKAIL